VEDAVDNDAVELLFEGSAEFAGIFADAVYADEDVAFELAFNIRIVEGDNVGICLVVEVFDVFGAEVFVGAEDEIYLVDGMLFLLGYALDPGGGFPGVGKFESDVFGEKIDCGHRLNSRFQISDFKFQGLVIQRIQETQ
jgi:hypothetical protein